MGRTQSPCLTRFLADFTLGFSDGLTVPFALTAGLSSLGRADTVIYAGLAELCAGSISMGISGYLSALDELPSAPSTSPATRRASSTTANSKRALSADAGDEEELKGMLDDPPPSATSTSSDGTTVAARASISDKERAFEISDEMLVRRHLEPLALPGSAVSDILMALRHQPDGLARAALELHENRRTTDDDEDPLVSARPLPPWPVASGLSISLGYVVGGVIPLLPYFFAPTIGLGLGWSIGLCLFALMAFGFGKTWLVRGKDASWSCCTWHGLQMLILGSLAAGAAVLCVHLLGGSGQAEANGPS
ncbi:hypothetical protein HIM_07063 [Hirsutella minnesotensis 3608]|uniref:Vacuolar iron transporter Ccc1 n=1 Tax=Hirsutella minnesotensis 3608 TaxID=1043627 RepID=A0A0F7ZZ30_9HYPO|nr:hypothetical protein HIM_07063 [Hirsutella minnesotensis 3608]